MPEKGPVRLVDVNGVIDPLVGAAPPVDGVAINPGDDVLLVNPPNGLAYAGPYVWDGTAWARRSDFDSPEDMVFASEVVVREGETRRHSKWRFVTTSAAQVDTDPLIFRMVDPGFAFRAGPQLEEIADTFNLTQTIDTPGTYSGIDIDKYGDAIGAVQPDVATTHKEGLEVVWESATALTVRAGNAFVPGLGRVVELPEDYPLDGLVLAASAWYYLYLYEDAGEPVVEAVTEAPDAPYLGRARTKGSELGEPDPTWRFLRTIRANASSQIRPFTVLPSGLVMWIRMSRTARDVGVAASTGGSDTPLTSWMPPHAEVIELDVMYRNLTNSTIFHVAGVDEGLITLGTPATGQGSITVDTGAASGSRYGVQRPLWVGTATQSLRAYQEAGGGTAFVSAGGFYEDI